MSSVSAHSHPESLAQDDTYLYHHFDDLQQQHDTSNLGMWVFLSTEVLFFGGALAAFAVVQVLFEREMAAASHHLFVMVGAVNTGVLLCSSLAMALAVRSAQLRQHRETVLFLLATIVLGSAFLAIKGYEWYVDYEEQLVPGVNFNFEKYPGRQVLFWSFYFTLTGIHALHMVIGVVILGITAGLVQRNKLTGMGATQIEVIGLYWHFVDIVWVFLYPLLYLIHA